MYYNILLLGYSINWGDADLYKPQNRCTAPSPELFVMPYSCRKPGDSGFVSHGKSSELIFFRLNV